MTHENEQTTPTTTIEMSNAVPKDFFIVKGIGQSDVAIHSGSFQFALKNAGIETCNILTYTSSMIPRTLTKIEQPTNIEPGTIMHSIMAVCNARRGQRSTSGIKYGWLYDRQTKEKFAGLIFSNWGYYTEADLNVMLEESLQDVYNSCYKAKYELRDIETVIESFIPTKTNGTTVVAMCFYNYIRAARL